MNLKMRDWSVFLNPIGIGKTATGWPDAMISILPIYGLFLILVVAQWTIEFMSLGEFRALIIPVNTLSIFGAVFAMWSPVSIGLIFRIRGDSGLKNVLHGVILYFPILSLAVFAVVALITSEFLLSSILISELKEWGLFALAMGLVGCIITAFSCRSRGNSDSAVVAITQTYGRIELGASLFSVLVIFAIFLA